MPVYLSLPIPFRGAKTYLEPQDRGLDELKRAAVNFDETLAGL